MKDFLKAFVPSALFVLVFVLAANKGDMGLSMWPYVIGLILTFTIVAYAVIRLFRQKRNSGH